MTKTPEETRAFYENQRNNPISLMNWGYLASELLPEVLARRGAVLSDPDVASLSVSKDRQMIKSSYAAEFFPDENPPRMVVAQTEQEGHDDLREKNPSKAKRISGKLIKLNNLGYTLFSLDAIASNNDTLVTKTKLPQVIDMLLDQGIVPVNALLEIIIPEMKTPRNLEDLENLFKSTEE